MCVCVCVCVCVLSEHMYHKYRASLVACSKEPTYQYRKYGFHSWVGEDTLEKEMAIHSSILAWEILCTEEPGR